MRVPSSHRLLTLQQVEALSSNRNVLRNTRGAVLLVLRAHRSRRARAARLYAVCADVAAASRYVAPVGNLCPQKQVSRFRDGSESMAQSKTFRIAILLLGLWLPIHAVAVAGMPCSEAVAMGCCQNCAASGRATGGSGNCSVCAAPLLQRHVSLSCGERPFSSGQVVYLAAPFVQAPLVPPPKSFA